MQFYLHADYVKAAAPRSSLSARHRAESRRAEPPPSALRAQMARALIGMAERLDRESAGRLPA